MSNKNIALVVAPFLFLLATGYTSCEYFTTVTVPASDTSKPTTYDAVYKDGEYVEGELAGENITYHLAPGEIVLAIGSAIDSGGTRRLTMYPAFRYTCCNSSNFCTVTQPVQVPLTDTQSGGVGSRVSNGIWLGSSVELPRCGSGYTLRSYSFSWFTEAEDFHGNVQRGGSHRIVYP